MMTPAVIEAMLTSCPGEGNGLLIPAESLKQEVPITSDVIARRSKIQA